MQDLSQMGPREVPIPKRSSAFWDSIATAYPDHISLLYHKKKEFDRSLLHPPDAGVRSRILDAGCGQGGDVSHFAQSGYSEVYGVDYSRRMVDIAKKKIMTYCSPQVKERVRIRLGDITNLDFPEKYFDVTCSFSTIDHLPSTEARERAVAQLVRVTKPGGRIILTFPNANALASMLKDHCDLLVSPANLCSIDIVKVANRSFSGGEIEYDFETSYDKEKLFRLVERHKLEYASISTGVMLYCSRIHSAHDIEFDGLGKDQEYLLDQTRGDNITASVSRIVSDWNAIKVAERGLRIGLVAMVPG